MKKNVKQDVSLEVAKYLHNLRNHMLAENLDKSTIEGIFMEPGNWLITCRGSITETEQEDIYAFLSLCEVRGNLS